MATQTPYDKGDYYDSHPDMTVVDKQAIEKAQADWEAANKAGDEAAKAAAHDRAEAIRATYGYSGGGDGTEYIPLEQEKPKQKVVTSSGGGGGISGSAPRLNRRPRS